MKVISNVARAWRDQDDVKEKLTRNCTAQAYFIRVDDCLALLEGWLVEIFCRSPFAAPIPSEGKTSMPSKT